MNKRDRIILCKIIEESEYLFDIIADIDEQVFLSDEKLMRATCMTLINIGELVKNLTEDFRLSHGQIPWKELAGLRDVTAHGYFTLRMDDIWTYAVKEMPDHMLILRDILNEEAE
jgi:uncharacterized protein with HEPN domain